MNNYISGSATGFILGIALVWWVRPDTNAGTAFVLVTSTILCFAVGGLLKFIAQLFQNRVQAGGNDEAH